MAGGKRPVFRPADERRVKAEFGYDDSIGVGACDREPSWLGTTRRDSRADLFPVLRKRRVKPSPEFALTKVNLL